MTIRRAVQTRAVTVRRDTEEATAVAMVDTGEATADMEETMVDIMESTAISPRRIRRAATAG